MQVWAYGLIFLALLLVFGLLYELKLEEQKNCSVVYSGIKIKYNETTKQVLDLTSNKVLILNNKSMNNLILLWNKTCKIE